MSINNGNHAQHSNTNGWDVVKAIFNGLFNLFKIEKIICIIILYLMYRDNYFYHNLPIDSDFSKYLIDTNIINRVFETQNLLVIVLFSIIAVCIAIIIIQIIITRLVYVKEIKRLTEERKELMHGIGNNKHEYINIHRTSEVL